MIVTTAATTVVQVPAAAASSSSSSSSSCRCFPSSWYYRRRRCRRNRRIIRQRGHYDEDPFMVILLLPSSSFLLVCCMILLLHTTTQTINAFQQQFHSVPADVMSSLSSPSIAFLTRTRIATTTTTTSSRARLTTTTTRRRKQRKTCCSSSSSTRLYFQRPPAAAVVAVSQRSMGTRKTTTTATTGSGSGGGQQQRLLQRQRLGWCRHYYYNDHRYQRRREGDNDRDSYHHRRPTRLQASPCLLTVSSFRGMKRVAAAACTRAAAKFRARPGTYLLIPCVAAAVGWLTNWLAVQMIFYPIRFRGIAVWQPAESPLGVLGWQGIVPCKTRPMAAAMVDMVTSQLLSVKEVFGRLDPHRVAVLLSPATPAIFREILTEVLPWGSGGGGASSSSSIAGSVPDMFYRGLDSVQRRILRFYNVEFLRGLCSDMQDQMDKLFDLKRCVVQQMMQDRTVLGQLFWKCGSKELDFLTNSGLWFGFLLGLIQMVVALFWENPWSLSIGGGIVGLATNWLALKWIFEPVDPVPLFGGRMVIQGQFLRRQPEVAAEFSKFFARNILTSQRLWQSLLTDPVTRPELRRVFGDHFEKFAAKITNGLFGRYHVLEPETLRMATDRALDKLGDHLPAELFRYMDETLRIEDTLRTRMEAMSSRQFERVLHPIFEEDELTLILAGAALGFAAGLVQQAIETGRWKFPVLPPPAAVPLRGVWAETAHWMKEQYRRVVLWQSGFGPWRKTLQRQMAKRIRATYAAVLKQEQQLVKTVRTGYGNLRERERKIVHDVRVRYQKNRRRRTTATTRTRTTTRLEDDQQLSDGTSSSSSSSGLEGSRPLQRSLRQQQDQAEVEVDENHNEEEQGQGIDDDNKDET